MLNFISRRDPQQQNPSATALQWHRGNGLGFAAQIEGAGLPTQVLAQIKAAEAATDTNVLQALLGVHALATASATFTCYVWNISEAEAIVIAAATVAANLPAPSQQPSGAATSQAAPRRQRTTRR